VRRYAGPKGFRMNLHLGRWCVVASARNTPQGADRSPRVLMRMMRRMMMVMGMGMLLMVVVMKQVATAACGGQTRCRTATTVVSLHDENACRCGVNGAVPLCPTFPLSPPLSRSLRLPSTAHTPEKFMSTATQLSLRELSACPLYTSQARYCSSTVPSRLKVFHPLS
jgi:hypothetical protein